MQIHICIGSACHIKGSYKVIQSMQQLVEEFSLQSKVELHAVFCLGHCTNAVSVRVDEGEVISLQPDTVREFFEGIVLPEVMGINRAPQREETKDSQGQPHCDCVCKSV